MFKILVVSHSELCKGILSAGEMILGDVSEARYVSLTDEGVEKFEGRLKEVLNEMKKETRDILIMADLFGGTPFNKSLIESINDTNIKVLTGVNLPMFMEGYMATENNLEDVFEAILLAGRDGVRVNEIATCDEDDE